MYCKFDGGVMESTIDPELVILKILPEEPLPRMYQKWVPSQASPWLDESPVGTLSFSTTEKSAV
jgi:hypothetical protein